MQRRTIVTSDTKQTQEVAESLGKTLQGGEVLCLYGDLGYGKTTFTQGLAKGLGVKRIVNSPTFIIMRSYKLIDEKTLYHVDLYRLEQEQEMIDIGLIDLLHKPEAIVVIEWPEKLGELLPQKRIDIRFSYRADNERSIIIEEH